MGFVDKSPEGRYRAYFRDPSGKQRSKTFRIKKDATAFPAEMETWKTRGAYVPPHAGRTTVREHAQKWRSAGNTEITTAARDLSVMRNRFSRSQSPGGRYARSRLEIKERILSSHHIDLHLGMIDPLCEGRQNQHQKIKRS